MEPPPTTLPLSLSKKMLVHSSFAPLSDPARGLVRRCFGERFSSVDVRVDGEVGGGTEGV
jgi:hypothetical protein